jgi:hypothetical protein
MGLTIGCQHRIAGTAQIANRVIETGWVQLQTSDLANLVAEVLKIALTLGTPSTGRGGSILEVLSPKRPKRPISIR